MPCRFSYRVGGKLIHQDVDIFERHVQVSFSVKGFSVGIVGVMDDGLEENLFDADPVGLHDEWVQLAEVITGDGGQDCKGNPFLSQLFQ